MGRTGTAAGGDSDGTAGSAHGRTHPRVGIYIVAGHVTPRLLSHECGHVHQYEVAGSIAAFLPVYLKQVMKYGYENAPYEVDARRHET